MSVVYFSIPVVIGYYIMQLTNKQAESNIGEKGKNLKDFPVNPGTVQQNKALQSILDRVKANKEK